MALGDHLRADQDGAVAPRRSARSVAASSPRLPAESASSRNRSSSGTRCLELPLESLRAGADPRELDRAALGAGLGRRLRVPAVVAVEAFVAVQDERDVAVGAAQRLAAGPAVERRRDAAPVEQQDRLAAVLGELAELARAAAPTAGSRPRRGGRRRAPAAGRRRSARRARAARAPAQLSGRGVALPKTATAPSSEARFAATVRAS